MNGCGRAGCILVIQSLTTLGFAGCYNSSNISQDCANYTPDVQSEADYFSKLGASNLNLYVNYRSANVGYSFIGNAGSGANQNRTGGTQYERVGCSDTRFQNPVTICDSLGPFSPSQNSPTDPKQIGAISGVLIRDNYNSFTFAPNAPQISYTFGTSSAGGTLVNVVSLNGSTTEGNGPVQYVQAQQLTGDSGSSCWMLPIPPGPRVVRAALARNSSINILTSTQD